MTESTNNKIPSPTTVINSADVVIDDKASLTFPILSQVQELKDQIEQQQNIPVKMNPAAHAELLKTVNYLSSLTINKVALYFSPESTKAAIHKQAIETCLKNNANGWQQAEAAVKQAENKLINLKTQFEEIKQAVTSIEGLLKGPATNMVAHHQKIKQNLADIKTLELVLQPTLTKIYFTVMAANAIDPTTIKQVFDVKQQGSEYAVLNKSNYVDMVKLFVKASEIVQSGSPQLIKLNEILSQKAAAFHKMKAEFEAFKTTLPTYPDEGQLKKATEMCDKLQLAIQEHDQLKAQVKSVEEQKTQAEKYLKYYQNWSESTQEEIDAAKLIQTKKQENVELGKQMESDMSLKTQIEPHVQKLVFTETQMKEQQKVVLDNQILLKNHQEATEYLQSETAQKLLELTGKFEAEVIAAADVAAPPVVAHVVPPVVTHIETTASGSDWSE